MYFSDFIHVKEKDEKEELRTERLASWMKNHLHKSFIQMFPP
jgi:hypothetical protein